MATIITLPAQARPVLSGVNVTVADGGYEVVHVLANAPVKPVKYFMLTNPVRVVVDLPAVENRGVSVPDNYNGSLISHIRFGQFNRTTSRLVLELHTSVQVLDIMPEKSGLRIELATRDGAVSTKPEAKPETKPIAAPVAQKSNLPMIVIDAGHGGKDSGALGLSKTMEKNITLAMAKALRDGLLKTGRYRVALTREDDRYILLPERVNIARKLNADMFISIHADSNPVPSARGLSIYTVSETASDAESQALAERENKSDIIGGLNLNTADKDVANILIDLTQHETSIKSADFADALVASMHPKILKLEGTHRFAGFRVLKASDVPSVLIELGFVSNAEDEKRLQSEAYQQIVVASIIKGVDRYRDHQKR